MSSTHFVEKCSKCKIVITQCRCSSKDKSVRWSVCSKCINEASMEALANVLVDYNSTVSKTDELATKCLLWEVNR